jgi:hypothetical protein
VNGDVGCKDKKEELVMNCYTSEDKEFIKCASDIEHARKRLDYLAGKRWFIGACGTVLAVIAIALYIGSEFIASDAADVEGSRFGAIMFACFAFLCLGFGGGIDSQVKSLILHVHRESSQQEDGQLSSESALSDEASS